MKHTALQSIKFLRLKRRLQVPHYQVVGVLESLWLFTQINAMDGAIGRHSDEDIAAAMEWPGDPTQLVEALVQSGWVDASPEFRLVVHDWESHCPTYVKGAMRRHKKEFIQEPAKQPAKEPPKQPPIAACQSMPQPNLTKPNLTKPNQNTVCPETKNLVSRPAAPIDASPVLMTFPTDGNPGEWNLTQNLADELAQLFPSQDVPVEARKALAWVLADPSRRKTAKGMRRFLTGWLGRNQDRGNCKQKPTDASPAMPAGQAKLRAAIEASRRAEMAKEIPATVSGPQDRPRIDFDGLGRAKPLPAIASGSGAIFGALNGVCENG